jgi:glycosyltransferase involved in cell wall biosynthesis
MQDRVFINGRFLTQTLSGVQRFATEIGRKLVEREPGRFSTLRPAGKQFDGDGARGVGRLKGQAWEQIELPRHVERGLLLNLGNTAPLRLRRQVVVLHDAGVFICPEAYSRRFRAWYKLLHAQLLRRGACLVTVSEAARGDIARCLNADPARIAVISEGADHMASVVPDWSVLERIPHNRFVLVVGNLAAHKNLPALGVLARTLASRGTALVVTGSLTGAAFEASATDHLPQPACYVGRVSDAELKALYSRAACLVMPSLYEGFGLPALEAMACRCPVAVSRIAALKETCGPAALYFDPCDPADIATRVLRLVDDPLLSERLRFAGMEHVSNFTWGRASSQLAGIIGAYRDRCSGTHHKIVNGQSDARPATAS